MKLSRNVSGDALARALRKHWGYAKVHQVGSHIILQTEVPSSHRISIPAHSPLRIGTFNAILRSVAAHKAISREQIVASL